jgi:hypothetical protein
MVDVPTAEGVSQVAARPLWSVVTVQEDAPLQTEKSGALLAVHPMVAPLTGVTPSAASTCTLTGFGACVPTGVEEFSPFPTSTIMSLAAAP